MNPYSWLPYPHADIKVETPAEFSLLSPPTSPFNSPSITNPTLPHSLHRSRSTSLASPKRPRPYPLPTSRESRSRVEDSEKMPQSPYAAWRGGSRSNERRSSDGDSLPYSATFTNVPVPYRDQRPPSSSSLSGAIGDHARFSSPQPRDEQLFSMGMTQPMWTPSPQQSPMPPMYPGVAGGHVYLEGTTLTGNPYDLHPESLTPPSDIMTDTTTTPYMSNATETYTSSSSMNAQEEIRRLRRRIQQLEQINAQERDHNRMLETELRKSGPSTPPLSASFQASWKTRTEARIRQFCSLNRAGNALCSWHDSRRERRIHPPRMAPPGYLNCGCTFEEALFEESLSRHGVGSYLPGETVRMDPALRNPLLKLLQQRYGYRDGDFERDPRSGDWVPGEGPAIWEAQIQAGITNPRRPKPVDHDRR